MTWTQLIAIGGFLLGLIANFLAVPGVLAKLQLMKQELVAGHIDQATATLAALIGDFAAASHAQPADVIPSALAMLEANLPPATKASVVGKLGGLAPLADGALALIAAQAPPSPPATSPASPPMVAPPIDAVAQVVDEAAHVVAAAPIAAAVDVATQAIAAVAGPVDQTARLSGNPHDPQFDQAPDGSPLPTTPAIDLVAPPPDTASLLAKLAAEVAALQVQLHQAPMPGPPVPAPVIIGQSAASAS